MCNTWMLNYFIWVKFMLSFPFPRGRPECSLKLLFILTTYTMLTKPTSFDYIAMLRLFGPPGLLLHDCWRKPDLDPVHQPLTVPTSSSETQPGGRWEPSCAPDSPRPSTAHLTSPPQAQFTLGIKASGSTLFSICPNLSGLEMGPKCTDLVAKT